MKRALRTSSVKKEEPSPPAEKKPFKKRKTSKSVSVVAEASPLLTPIKTLPLEGSVVKKTSPEGAFLKETTLPSSKVSLKSLKFVGAHMSIAKGPKTAVEGAVAIGASAFALFVRSARTWKCPPLSDAAVDEFRTRLAESGISPSKIVCHGSYLINPGAPDDEILEKSRAGMLDEVQRCERLGVAYYNVHPGSTCGKISVKNCIFRIAESVKKTLKKTKNVTILLENMSCQGNTIGGKLSELAEIISLINNNNDSNNSNTNINSSNDISNTNSNGNNDSNIDNNTNNSGNNSNNNNSNDYTSNGINSISNVSNDISISSNSIGNGSNSISNVINSISNGGNGNNKNEIGNDEKVNENFSDRIGVCLDTCHAFAAGNDISTLAGWNKFMSEVENVIGLEKVKAFHLNDSTFACGAHKDRHALIGKGFIGLEAFRILMNDPRTNNLPMILETEGDAFTNEVQLLYSLCKT